MERLMDLIHPEVERLKLWDATDGVFVEGLTLYVLDASGKSQRVFYCQSISVWFPVTSSPECFTVRECFRRHAKRLERNDLL